MIVLISCPSLPETHELLLSPDLHLLQMMMQTFQSPTGSDSLKLYISMGFNKLAQKLSSCEVMLDLHVPQFVLSLLQKDATDPKDWDGDSYQYYLVSFLSRFCRLRRGADLVTQLGGASVVNSMCLLGPSAQIFLDAAFASVFVSGRDETAAVLERQPALLDLVVDVFQNAVDGLEGDGYYFGAYKIPFLVDLVAVLAISDANKRPLLENEHVLPLLVNVLRRFQENQPQYSGMDGDNVLRYAGGGGKDTESAAKAVEALLQLSFFYAAGDDDADLRARFLEADPAMVKLLGDMVEMPPSPLEQEDRAGLSALLQRLVTVLRPPRSPTPRLSRMSGCWTQRYVESVVMVMVWLRCVGGVLKVC
jgi:hypothetical protein